MFRTLIVEDGITFRQLLKNNLSNHFPSMVIDEAGDGKEALEKVETFRPNLIFMDIQLPGENGLSLTKKIKALYPHIIILVMTSYTLPEYRESAFKFGASYFLDKASLDEEEIVKLIESIPLRQGFA